MNDDNRGRHVLPALGVLLLLALAPLRAAHATFFDVDGVVQTCVSLACDAANIDVGDPLSGFIEVDDAASGPNSTFTQADVVFLELTVGGVTTGGPGAAGGSATLNTDGDGEIASGTIAVVTTVDTPLGTATVDITADAAAGTWQADTTFFGLGTIASGTIGFTRRQVVDTDGDGVEDSADNCIEVPNADQRDSNGDLFGNVCDPDLTNDGIVNAGDLGLLKAVFFTADADADFNGDGVVNVTDLGVMRLFFFGPPGPSGPAGP